jgi:hypothetical protein
MSTRSTVLYTNENDHIWEETTEGAHPGVHRDDIVVEVGGPHIADIEVSDDGVSFVVRKGCELHAALLRLRQK